MVHGMASDGSSASFVVVANRLPVEAVTDGDGPLSWRVSPGGLVAALGPVMQRNEGTWVGWTGTADEAVPPFCAEGMRLVPMELSTE
jgi:trehalose 6-phosphate synthase